MKNIYFKFIIKIILIIIYSTNLKKKNKSYIKNFKKLNYKLQP